MESDWKIPLYKVHSNDDEVPDFANLTIKKSTFPLVEPKK